MSIRTSLVIPCYDEADSIAQLCGRLEEVIPTLEEAGPVEIVFVDDGSSDGTAQIIEREANGELNEHEPHYHRFDRDYRSSRLPNGVRQFIVAVTIVCGVLGGAIVFASYSADCGASQYPPCFSHAELGETQDGVPAPRTAR